jgi:cytochrome c553
MPGLLQRTAAVVLGSALLGVLAVVGGYAFTQFRITTSVNVPTDHVIIPTDVASVKRGQHIVGAIAVCTQCHGPTLGGAVVQDDRSARVVAPNLTRGGIGATYTDADFVRAIGDGVDPSGRQLWMMPTDDYHHLSDDDLGALIAFLKSLPPTTADLPTDELHPYGRLRFALGRFDLLPAERVDRSTPRPPAVAVDLSPAYGEYLVLIAGCARCHGEGLSGGVVPGAPSGARPAANLTPTGLGNWSEADFVRAMRAGRRPDGSAIDTAMPWPYFAQMSDLELRAIWAFLSVGPPRQTGAR